MAKKKKVWEREKEERTNGMKLWNGEKGRTDQREETKKVDADETEKFGTSVYIVVFN